MGSQTAVQDRLERRTAAMLSDLREAWGTTETVGPVEYGPLPWHPDSVPDTVGEQLETFAGIASVATFYTAAHEETVLVYNRNGHWQPSSATGPPASSASSGSATTTPASVAASACSDRTLCRRTVATGSSCSGCSPTRTTGKS